MLRYLAARCYLQMHFETCKLQYGASTAQKCSASTPLLLRLRSEDFKPRQCRSLIVVLIRPFLSHFRCGAERIMLPKEESGNLVSMKGCSWSATMLGVRGTCRSKMDGCLRQLALSSSCIPVPCLPWASDAH